MSRPQINLTVVPGIVVRRDVAQLIIGPRHSAGLGQDLATGSFYVDVADDNAELALKIDPTGAAYAETNPEPPALLVGVDAGQPYYEKD